MKRANWSIGVRPRTRYFTVHYNGPPVKAFGNPQGEIAQLQFDAVWHMRPGGVGAVNGADGIQYHGATLSDGTNLQLRNWNAKLWHCGNFTGNEESVAWQIPIGGAQRATEIQLHNLFNIVIPSFQHEYGILVVNIKGHMEWKATDCPGTLQPLILDWRSRNSGILELAYYQTLVNVNVRESPEVQSAYPGNIALDGSAVIPAGTRFAVDKIVFGTIYHNVNTYLHRADGLGFILNDPQLVKKVL